MGLVKTRRLAAMQKQQRAKAGMRPPEVKCGVRPDDGAFFSRGGNTAKREGVVDRCGFLRTDPAGSGDRF